MSISEVDYIFKVLIIGDSSVGKSNILLRFSDNTFQETFLPTIGVDFKIKNLAVYNKNVKLNIWDTAGQERFKTITSAYYKGSHGVIIVYDITDKEGFNNVSSWINEAKKHAGPNVARILVGNKCDLQEERKVAWQEGKDFADREGMQFFECSAKAKINIMEIFEALAKKMYEHLPETERKDEMDDLNLRKRSKDDSKKKCC